MKNHRDGSNDVISSFRSSCSLLISSNAELLKSRKREPREGLSRTLGPARRSKESKNKDDGRRPHRTAFSKAIDFQKCVDMIREGPDGAPEFVHLLTGSDFGQIDALRDSSGNAILHLLIQRGFRENIKFVYSMGCNMNEINSSGFTGIALACRLGDLETVTCMFSMGGNPCVAGPDGKTSLHWSVIGGNVEVVAYILKVSRNIVDARDLLGMTALHYAASFGKADTCEILIRDGGAIPDLTDKHGVDPAHWGLLQHTLNGWLRGALDLNKLVAAQGSKECIMNVLIDQGIAEQENAEKIKWDAFTGETGILNFLIGSGIDPSSSDEFDKSKMPHVTEVIEKAKLANLKMLECTSLEEMRSAVSQGGCVNTVEKRTGLSPIHFSVLNGSVDILKFLIENKADVNKTSEKSGWTALHYAVLADKGADCIQLLLEADTQVTPSIICACISGGSEKGLDELVRKGGNGILEDPIGGVVPMFFAARSGKTEICLYMMQKKVRADTLDVDGRNAFLIACAFGHTVTAISLGEESLKQKQNTSIAALFAVDNLKRNGIILLSMCQASSFHGSRSSIDRFLDMMVGAGIDMNHEDSHGQSALMYAARVGNDLLCESLIKRGAMKDKASKIALQSGFLDLSLKIDQIDSSNSDRPVSNESSRSIFSASELTLNPGLGLKRDQNVQYLCHQASTPLGLRFENIPPTMNSKSFAEFLIHNGSRPASVRVLFDPLTGKHSRYAYASFSDRIYMQGAAKLSNQLVEDRRVKVYVDDSLLSGTAPENHGVADWMDVSDDPAIVSKNLSTSKPFARRKTIRFTA